MVVCRQPKFPKRAQNKDQNSRQFHIYLVNPVIIGVMGAGAERFSHSLHRI